MLQITLYGLRKARHSTTAEGMEVELRLRRIEVVFMLF